jgi:hypothetical protein
MSAAHPPTRDLLVMSDLQRDAHDALDVLQRERKITGEGRLWRLVR